MVVGPRAVASEYVAQEWRFAYFEADKCVNPIVRLDGATPAGEKIDGLPKAWRARPRRPHHGAAVSGV
jgi:hypothetical protein